MTPPEVKRPAPTDGECDPQPKRTRIDMQVRLSLPHRLFDYCIRCERVHLPLERLLPPWLAHDASECPLQGQGLKE